LARAATRLRGAPAPDPRSGRTREGRAQRQGVRVPRRRTSDPRGGAAGGGGRRADQRSPRRPRRRSRRRRRDGVGALRPAPPLARGNARRRPARRGVARARLAACARRGAGGPPGAARMRKLTSFLFLASVFCVTFEKVHWSIAGNVSLADVLAILFLASFL